MSRYIKILKLSGALAALAIGGCVVLSYLGLAPETDRIFSHERHQRPDIGQECKSCHKLSPDGKNYEMPALKKCMGCHEGRPDEQKIKEVYGDPPKWSSFAALEYGGIEEGKFSHKTHLDGKVACGECHKGIEGSTSVTTDVRVGMETCTSCHAARGKSNDCAACHTKVGKDWAPPSHQHNWKPEHGAVVKAGQVPPVSNNCSLCHQESACVKCHQDEQPKSHNDFWRIQGHALAVSIDRSSCATCHRTDFCDRCHQHTPPRSHVASWGSPQDKHCVGCHFPLGATDQNCGLCHKSMPGHLLAARQPSWHTPGMNCRQCHGAGLVATLPHPDNVSDCTICHH